MLCKIGTGVSVDSQNGAYLYEIIDDKRLKSEGGVLSLLDQASGG